MHVVDAAASDRTKDVPGPRLCTTQPFGQLVDRVQRTLTRIQTEMEVGRRAHRVAGRPTPADHVSFADGIPGRELIGIPSGEVRVVPVTPVGEVEPCHSAPERSGIELDPTPGNREKRRFPFAKEVLPFVAPVAPAEFFPRGSPAVGPGHRSSHREPAIDVSQRRVGPSQCSQLQTEGVDDHGGVTTLRPVVTDPGWGTSLRRFSMSTDRALGITGIL